MNDLREFRKKFVNMDNAYAELFNLDNLDLTYLEKKKWGYKYNLFASPFVAIDICWVNKGGYCSWHFHRYKYNTFFVLLGTLEIKRESRDDDFIIFDIGPAEKERRAVIHPNFKHQFKAIEDTLFIEIETVRCLKDDIYRDNEGGIEE